ncbi:MAG TPA: hypothetical protein VL360_08410 [Gammaproteobacteria bacterium]|nr:hypothetical protein [Gammaproteobacteria bacterium]
MQSRSTVEQKKNSTIAALKAQISASQVTDNNNQRATTQSELAGLRKRAVTVPQTATDPDGNHANSIHAAEELNNLRVSHLRNKLFSQQNTAPASMQKQATLSDIEKLRAGKGNVLAKAKQLELFFQQSRRALDVVKSNKVSEAAKAEFAACPLDLKVFESQQGTFINDVKVELEKDIREFANDPKLQEIGYARFLELSFYYHAYEVCLEQDFRRHVAAKLYKSKMNLTHEQQQGVDVLCGIPTQRAIESLNYYNDFYNNLNHIEKIWPHAGIRIRKAEVRVTYGADNCRDLNLLLKVLGDKSTEQYRSDRSQFENAFAAYYTESPFVKDFVENGDGLNMGRHPWALSGRTRLPQANATINFKDIVPVDASHADAVHQVEERVEADKISILRPGL